MFIIWLFVIGRKGLVSTRTCFVTCRLLWVLSAVFHHLCLEMQANLIQRDQDWEKGQGEGERGRDRKRGRRREAGMVSGRETNK